MRAPRPSDPQPDRPARAHAVRRAARAAWDAVAGLVYPELCLGCEARLPTPPDASRALPLCAACVRALPREASDACQALLADAPVDLAVALWRYDAGGTVRRVQHALKYGGQARLGLGLGHLVGRAAQAAGVQPDLVAPVPLSPVRLLERGYNQAAALAEGVAAELGVPLRTDVVVRTRATPSQTRLDRAERRANVDGAFAVPHPEAVAGRQVLVVDDVLTTGATLAAVAAALGAAGARVSVAALALAS